MTVRFTRFSLLERLAGTFILIGMANLVFGVVLPFVLNDKIVPGRDLLYLDLALVGPLSIFELLLDLSVKRSFCKYLEKSGDLVEKYVALKIKPYMNDPTRDFLRSDGFDL
ncbi:MAG: hypothetical protein AABX38_06645 [Candidatus Micrarchaeota archaeon]